MRLPTVHRRRRRHPDACRSGIEPDKKKKTLIRSPMQSHSPMWSIEYFDSTRPVFHLLFFPGGPAAAFLCVYAHMLIFLNIPLLDCA